MTVRLDRLVAHRCGLSRKRALAVVRAGRVTVDGTIVNDPAQDVDECVSVALDGDTAIVPPRLAVFHKPVGVHSTVSDPQGRPCLADSAAELLGLGLHPVGRLDHDTSGLLLFSSDGKATQWLLHPRRAVPRTYVATTNPAPVAALIAALAAGVTTGEGMFTATSVTIDEDRVTLTVTEGKHRMVRRMLHNAGHSVVDLHRIAYGALSLGDLAVGAWRPASLLTSIFPAVAMAESTPTRRT